MRSDGGADRVRGSGGGAADAGAGVLVVRVVVPEERFGVHTYSAPDNERVLITPPPLTSLSLAWSCPLGPSSGRGRRRPCCLCTERWLTAPGSWLCPGSDPERCPGLHCEPSHQALHPRGASYQYLERRHRVRTSQSLSL